MIQILRNRASFELPVKTTLCVVLSCWTGVAPLVSGKQCLHEQVAWLSITRGLPSIALGLGPAAESTRTWELDLPYLKIQALRKNSR